MMTKIMTSWCHNHYHDIIIIVMTSKSLSWPHDIKVNIMFIFDNDYDHDNDYDIMAMIVMSWHWLWCHDMMSWPHNHCHDITMNSFRGKPYPCNQWNHLINHSIHLASASQSMQHLWPKRIWLVIRISSVSVLVAGSSRSNSSK